VNAQAVARINLPVDSRTDYVHSSTGASLGTIRDPGGDGVNSLAFSVMGTQLAVADKNGTTYVWTLAG
jgi:WD40 repeat protein